MFRPLLNKAWRRWALLGAVVVALVLSMGLVAARVVKVKMLPFDNKSELQVVIDMPEGSTLEQTAGIARSLAETVRTLPEVTDVQIYVGTSAPFNFNGLVRHYFLRSGPLVADLQINLLPKHHRDRASHPFAKELRDLLAPVVEGTQANVKVTEVPPGPPVLSTMVAEIYGPDLDQRLELAQQVREIFEMTPGIVDVDWWVENPGPQVDFEVDREKAVRAGTTPEAVVRTLRVALEGAEAVTALATARVEESRCPWSCGSIARSAPASMAYSGFLFTARRAAWCHSASWSRCGQLPASASSTTRTCSR